MTDTDELPPVDEVPAAHVLGRTLRNGWRVVERLTKTAGATGGHFSIAYFVENDRGDRAFLKALNVAAVLGFGGGRLIDRMKEFADSFVYERDLFQHCGQRQLTRVIRLLDYGEIDIPEAGILREVPYLIFEPADGDIRAHQARMGAFDLAWALTTLKHASTGIEQLHSSQTAHQDLKPSNILTQNNGQEMKLGDLGRAERRAVAGPNTDNDIPGAVGYAPPEQLYGAFTGDWEERRAADLYHLGSLLVQMFLGSNVTAVMQEALRPEFRFRKWRGDFDTVLPYLQHAHSEMLREFEDAVSAVSPSASFTASLVAAAAEMTQPDPDLRGHPRDKAARTSSYAVRRYVSLFNRLAAEARISAMGKK